MAKREPLRDEIIECAGCGKRIGRFSKVYEIPSVEGLVCNACDFDSRRVDFDEAAAMAFIRSRRQEGMHPDRILPALRKHMREPDFDRYWERAGAWNAMDIHDYMTRNLNWPV